MLHHMIHDIMPIVMVIVVLMIINTFFKKVFTSYKTLSTSVILALLIFICSHPPFKMHILGPKAGDFALFVCLAIAAYSAFCIFKNDKKENAD